MIDILLVFEDRLGLMDALRKSGGYDVSYNDEGLEKPENCHAMWLGARIPFADLRHIILQTLERYPHIRYYAISGDFFKPPDFVHDQVVVGGLTSAALGRKIRPIEPAQMISMLQGMTDASQLKEFVRQSYPASRLATGFAGTDESTGVAAVAADEIKPIRALEYRDDSTNRYAMSINLFVESVDEFMNLMTFVKEAFINWLGLRRNDAALFRFAVEAPAGDHEEIDSFIKRVYAEEDQLSALLPAVDFDVTIEDTAGGAAIHYLLKGVPR